jgi:hypothetical protein
MVSPTREGGTPPVATQSLAIAVFVAILASAACGGNSSGPTAPSNASQSCRVYATSSRAVQTVELGSERVDLWQMASTCRWNADRLLPPVPKTTSIAVTSSAGSCPSPFEARHQYDATGRLVRISSGSSTNFAANSTKTFTAWDSRGRPTEGAFTNFRVTGPVTLRYDDAARSVTEVASYDNGNWVVTTTTAHDANGIVVRDVLSDAIPGEARPTYTTITTVLATDRVCK